MAAGPGELCKPAHKGAADSNDVQVHVAHCTDRHNGFLNMNEFQDFNTNSADGIRQEIAAIAARMIAEDGLDYGNAKRKAYSQITGRKEERIARELMPSNEEVEDAVRSYQQIFQSDEQPQRLLELRKRALSLMTVLKDFSPTVTGAIVNGTAGAHSDIHLQCFADNAKEIGIFLLNQGVNTEATTLPHFRPGFEDVEALVLKWEGEFAVIAIFPEVDLRGSMKPDGRGRIQRLDRQALEKLIHES